MRPFDLVTKEKSKNMVVKAEVWEKRLLLKSDHYSNPADSISSGVCLLGEDSLKTAPEKNSSLNMNSSGVTEEIKEIELDDLEMEVVQPNINEYSTPSWQI